MKRADLKVGMTVEDKNGREFVVVTTEGWTKRDDFLRRATGHDWGSHPIVANGYRATPGNRAQGVLVVRQRSLADAAVGETVLGQVMSLRQLFPAGNKAAATKARQAAYEAAVDADEKRDRELVEQARHYWGDKTDYLLGACGIMDDDGLLTEREVQKLLVVIVCGQNR